MKLIPKTIFFLFFNLLLSKQLYSQDKIDPKCLKVLKYIDEYNFPVNTSNFEKLFKKNFYSDGTYNFVMNLNDTTLCYLYSIYEKDEYINLTDGIWMRGKDITFDYLQYNHIAVGYSICDNCIMVYYIGAESETDHDVTLNVEYFRYNGDKITFVYNDGNTKIDVIELFGSYDYGGWIQKTTIIYQCSMLKTWLILNGNTETEERYLEERKIDVESGRFYTLSPVRL